MTSDCIEKILISGVFGSNNQIFVTYRRIGVTSKWHIKSALGIFPI